MGGELKMKWYRIKYGWNFYHIRNPFTMWRFYHDEEASGWCDRLQRLIDNAEPVKSIFD
jgi:hypothetical protein